MDIEYEATFSNIDKNEIRKKLLKIGAILIENEFTQTRKAFYLPDKDIRGFLRVRKEGSKTTMTLKMFEGDKIEDQKEIEIIVSDFDKAVSILKLLGIEEKAFQETTREIWKKDDVEIMIDTWPFLESFVEIEGKSEEVVKKVSQEIGFSWDEAIFAGVDEQYARKYGITKEQVNNRTPRIVFDMENPFIKK